MTQWKAVIRIRDVGPAHIVKESEEIPLDPVFPLIDHFVQDPSDKKWYLVYPHTREIVVAYKFGLFWKTVEEKANAN